MFLRQTSAFLISCLVLLLVVLSPTARAQFDPIAHWTFDEQSGVVAEDTSGNGNTGTLIGDPAREAGRLGGALSFDGVDDYVATTLIPFDPSIRDFTVALWFRVDARGSDEHLISQGDGSGTGRGWLGNDVSRGIYSFLGRVRTDTQFIPELGQWHHAALTKSGTTVQIYVDGQLKATNPDVKVEPADGTLFLGSNKTATLGHFNGALDDVRVYDEVLDAATIRALYDSGASTSLIAHWTFDEPSGTEAEDVSGNGNTGTLVGDPIRVAGQLGGALSLDGIDDRVDTVRAPFDPSATDFSLSMWFRVDAQGSDEHLISQGDGSGIGRAWLGNDVSRGIYSFLGRVRTDTQFIPELGQWHHAALTKSGTTVQIYVDGQLKATNPDVKVEPADGTLFLGSNKTATLGHFNGALDDVRVHDEVLDAATIRALYDSGASTSLIAH
ncbi:MAG: LamG domain-containing protein [Gammaproteobacteria bacterium]|nr:LamG domain-containing protein [Gammaproteobacteria bacterium]